MNGISITRLNHLSWDDTHEKQNGGFVSLAVTCHEISHLICVDGSFFFILQLKILQTTMNKIYLNSISKSIYLILRSFNNNKINLYFRTISEHVTEVVVTFLWFYMEIGNNLLAHLPHKISIRRSKLKSLI